MDKLKLLAIYPGIGVGGFRCNSGEGAWIHHGLGLIASFVSNKGFNVELMDMRNYPNRREFIIDLNTRQYDVVGITISYDDYPIVKRLIGVIRRLNPKAKIVVGGYTPSIMTDRFTDWDIDHLIIGEGELAMLDIIQGKPKPRVIKGEQIPLDELPYINRSFYNYPKEMACTFVPGQLAPMITMISGRGCPHLCTFCQPAENSIYGRPYRSRSVNHVIGELIELREKYPFKSVVFWDDTFTINKKWVMEFCDAYQANGFIQDIIACCRADILCNNVDMIKRLQEIGLKWFIIGVESGSQRMLDFLKKGTTVEQNIKAVMTCHELGIKTYTSFMLGLPTETKEEQRATIDLIKMLNPTHPSMFWFRPIYGTEIYQYCVDNDLLLQPNNLNIDRTGQYHATIKGIDYEYLNHLRAELLIDVGMKQKIVQIVRRGK